MWGSSVAFQLIRILHVSTSTQWGRFESGRCNNHLEKYEFVNGKDYPIIPYIMEKKHVWNHQPDTYQNLDWIGWPWKPAACYPRLAREPFRSAPVKCGSIFMDRGHRKWGNDVWWCLASKNWDSSQKLHFANNSSKGGHQKTLIKSLASWIIVFPSFGWCLPSFLGSNQWNVCKKHQNINHIPSGHLTVCFWK